MPSIPTVKLVKENKVNLKCGVYSNKKKISFSRHFLFHIFPSFCTVPSIGDERDAIMTQLGFVYVCVCTSVFLFFFLTDASILLLIFNSHL